MRSGLPEDPEEGVEVMGKRRKPRTLLERIVADRVGQTLTGTISAAVDKIAEEIAREALADETFRRLLRELVQQRSTAMLSELLHTPKKEGKR
jgi:hypothetical protein